jgi:hypothetical protein
MPIQDTYSAVPELVVRLHTAAGAAAADYDGRMFLAFDTYEVLRVDAHWQTAGSSTTAALDVVKIPNGQAKASGTSVLAGYIDASQTANTRYSGTLNATLANRQLAVGDSLAVNGAGTLTALDGVTVQVVLRKI